FILIQRGAISVPLCESARLEPARSSFPQRTSRRRRRSPLHRRYFPEASTTAAFSAPRAIDNISSEAPDAWYSIAPAGANDMSHVLLVDDDPLFIAEQVRKLFPAPAHTLSIAQSGSDGISAVRDSPPDVVLLDLRLPDLSGLSVYEAIRK